VGRFCGGVVGEIEVPKRQALQPGFEGVVHGVTTSSGTAADFTHAAMRRRSAATAALDWLYSRSRQKLRTRATRWISVIPRSVSWETSTLCVSQKRGVLFEG
jgi:hypothetical protein